MHGIDTYLTVTSAAPSSPLSSYNVLKDLQNSHLFSRVHWLFCKMVGKEGQEMFLPKKMKSYGVHMGTVFSSIIKTWKNKNEKSVKMSKFWCKLNKYMAHYEHLQSNSRITHYTEMHKPFYDRHRLDVTERILRWLEGHVW